MVFGKVGDDEDRLGSLPPSQCLRVHYHAPAPGLHQHTGAVDLRLLKSFNLLGSQKHQPVCNPFSATWQFLLLSVKLVCGVQMTECSCSWPWTSPPADLWGLTLSMRLLILQFTSTTL